MGEEIKNLYDPDVTMISNDFLKKHLADADSFYVKVYIYYLWKKLDKIDIHKAADDLNLTDNDVERAIKYWISKKVLTKDTIKKEEIQCEKIVNQHSLKEKNEEIQCEKTANLVSFKEKKEELLSKKEDEQVFNEIIFFAETVLPNTISSMQYDALRKMYMEMKLSVEVIEYLIEYIAQNETYTSKYMLAIANSWYEQGIKTKNQAKAFTEKFGKGKKTQKTKSAKRKSSLEREYDEFSNSTEISLESKDIFK